MKLFGRKKKENKPQTGKEVLIRSYLTMAFLLACLAFLLYRLAYLQLIAPDEYRNKATEQYTTEVTIYAKRGNIYDRNMKLLATSSTVQTVYISPADIADDEQLETVVDGLVNILGVDRETVLEKAAKKKSRYQIIMRNVGEEKELELREYIEKNNLSNQICMEESTKRYYPYSSLASQTIGFVGAENTGLYGAEYYYNSVLTGTNGRAIQGQDGLGNELAFQYETYIDAEDGIGIELTIDYYIQSVLEKYLRECVEEHNPTYGARGIIMDPSTGEILAIASIGDYDLNDYSTLTGEYLEKYEAFIGTDEEKKQYRTELLYEMWKNKCASELYEPGSTFKIITTAIGLEEGIFDENTIYNCTGSIDVLGTTIHCHTSPHHEQTVTEALVNSCNPAFVQMGLDIGGELFYKYLEAFGYTSTTGSDISGEASSIYFKNLNNQLNLANNAFGQSISITMLQHIAAVSSIANGGYVVTPHILKGYVSSDGTVSETSEFSGKRQVISETTAKTILNALVNSTKNAAVSGYNVSSKTGTSQKLDRGKKEDGSYYYISSCVSFAPSEDPQVAILIVVDEPTGSVFYGSQVAAPVISNVLGEVLDYLAISSEKENTIETFKIDDYKNSALDRAKFSIESMGLTCITVGDGKTVTEQMPRAGTTISEGGTVILYTENSAELSTVKVKNFEGMTPENVFKWFSDHNLNIITVGIYNKDYKDCYAYTQSIPAGTEVKAGSVVEITFKYDEDIQ